MPRSRPRVSTDALLILLLIAFMIEVPIVYLIRGCH